MTNSCCNARLESLGVTPDISGVKCYRYLTPLAGFRSKLNKKLISAWRKLWESDEQIVLKTGNTK